MHPDRDVRASPRPLDTREREILEFLLTVDAEGVDELRKQAEQVTARPWTCGCASIDLIVEPGSAPASSITARPAIETTTKVSDDPGNIFDLLLWVDDGFLSGVEIVDYAESHGERSKVFPPPAVFETPTPRRGSG